MVDADTWDVGGTRVRLHGIDAPELSQTCGDWKCGLWATAQVRKRYQGQQADCRAVDMGRYGRIVAKCMVKGEDVGQYQVAAGLAFAYRKYSTAYVREERAAVAANRGLHAGPVDPPWLYRAGQVAEVGPNGCRIKGNISSSGKKIYHRPGQSAYGRTRISTSKGERWFCSAEEARRAGWRAAKN